MGDVMQYDVPKKAPVAATPDYMLQLAIEKGASLEQLEKLMDLRERYETNEARKAFVAAMAAFKANPPDLVKDKHVAFSGTAYNHVSLAAVVDAVSQSLSEHGLSHRWDVDQKGEITVTCVITHMLGHSERVSMSAPADDSGKKNRIQQIASTITYLQRYTLMSATGLAARDMDDDAAHAEPVSRITDEQAATLKGLIAETNSDTKAFLKACGGGATSVDEIAANRYASALLRLNEKKEKQRGNS